MPLNIFNPVGLTELVRRRLGPSPIPSALMPLKKKKKKNANNESTESFDVVMGWR